MPTFTTILPTLLTVYRKPHKHPHFSILAESPTFYRNIQHFIALPSSSNIPSYFYTDNPHPAFITFTINIPIPYRYQSYLLQLL